MNNIKVLLVLITLLISSCVNDSSLQSGWKDITANIHAKKYNIHELALNKRPYFNEQAPSLSNLGPVDRDSVPVYKRNGKQYYHPVYTSKFGINFIDEFLRNGDKQYLDLAKKVASKLNSYAVLRKDVLLFPYNFDFSLVIKPPSEKMYEPWYSGMAQGRILTLFSRLYQATGNIKYLHWAQNTFKSFQITQEQAVDWIAYIDQDNYYWIEEYPTNNPMHVLNGFIFGIFGLYDYYLISHDPECLKIMNAAITTVEHYISDFRNPGHLSFYGLKYKRQKEHYHYVHIYELNMLHKITGDHYFKAMADSLKMDYYNK